MIAPVTPAMDPNGVWVVQEVYIDTGHVYTHHAFSSKDDAWAYYHWLSSAYYED